MEQRKPDPNTFYRWFYTCERTGKRRKTKWHMTPQDAAASADLQGPLEADLSTAEVRTPVGGAGDLRFR
jgi:hypothetical protein